MARANIDELQFAQVPYRKHGRTAAGADCWGFARLACQSIGIELPEFNDISIRDREACESFISAETVHWARVGNADARSGDIVHMNTVNTCRGSVRLLALHIGVITKPGRVMHLEGISGVQAVPLWHASVRDRIIGIYRLTHDTRARYDSPGAV